MSTVNKPANRLTRGIKPDWLKGGGPYVGRIVNHLDSEFMGRLEVEILKISESGNEDSDTSSGYSIPCSYVSPFYGVTPRSGVTDNPGFDFTQKSYGLWAIPPDIGVKVLVFFAEDNYGHGFWMGCIQDKNMNFMIPGGASTTYNDENKSKPRPVGEYNKKREKAAGKDATQYIKPCNMDACNILDSNGLAGDQTRGTNTSSARRELPSMVFGWSTPGPYDRRSGKPKVAYGEKFGQSQVPFSRLGGSNFIMDDGDASLLRKTKANAGGSEYANVEKGETGDVTVPHNEFVKLKTRTGHQILLHNSEDLIYISHGSGNSWIELTANGKIDIYAKDSVSIRTENDLNIKAERDMNIEAMNNINIKAGNEMRLHSVAPMSLKTDDVMNLESTAEMNIKTADQMNLQSSADMSLKIGADGKITTSGKLNLDTSKVVAGSALDVDGPIKAKGNIETPANMMALEVKGIRVRSTHPPVTIGGGMAGSAGGSPSSAASAGSATPADLPMRLPSFEPWDGHENVDPTLHTPDKTDSSSVTQPGSGTAGMTRDTFRKTNG